MKHFLLVFDRRAGHLLSLDECPDRGGAIAARFAKEREHRGQADIEVVILGAESEQALPTTHSRYFKNVDQLAKVATG